MPPKSQKQKRFMAAVANNPEFANKVGVPQNVGAEFMKKKKVKKYQEGREVRLNERELDILSDRDPRLLSERNLKQRMQGVGGFDNLSPQGQREMALDLGDLVAEKLRKPRSRKRPKRMMGGGKVKKGYKYGGKVRGCGKAKKGVRPAKMVKMKGA